MSDKRPEATVEAEFQEADSKNPTCEVCGEQISEDNASCRIQIGRYSAGRFYPGGTVQPAHYKCLWIT